MQDLRGAAELVSRDLRRAGHWAAAASGVRRGDEPIVVNPHAEIAAASGAAAVVALSFSTGAGDAASVDDSERFGFRLRNGAIEVQLGARNWQALSDPGTVVVTSFSVVPRVDEADLADVLRQAVQRRQHDLPAAPADPQLRDQRRRPLCDRCARDARAAQRRSRSQRHRRRQLRGMTAMSHRSPFARPPRASLARRPARRRRPLRDRHALLRDGPRGRRRAPQRRRRGAAIGQRAARRQAPSKPPKPASTGRSHASTIRPGSAPIACRAPTRRRSRFASAWFGSTSRRAISQPRTWMDGGTPVPLQAACVRGANGWICRCPADGRPDLPASVGSAMAPAFVVELAASTRRRRRSRAGDGLHAQRLPARPARQASTRPAKRRPGSKPRGRCCRRFAPRRPPR